MCQWFFKNQACKHTRINCTSWPDFITATIQVYCCKSFYTKTSSWRHFSQFLTLRMHTLIQYARFYPLLPNMLKYSMQKCSGNKAWCVWEELCDNPNFDNPSFPTMGWSGLYTSFEELVKWHFPHGPVYSMHLVHVSHNSNLITIS